MADRFFPQLRTGAIAQYPIRKTAATRTVLNVLPNGNIVTYPDDAARKLIWNWDYVGLATEEAATLQSFFVACSGPLRPFTFLDPTGNLLSASSDFSASLWQASSGLKFNSSFPGPVSTAQAITLVNDSQAVQELQQSLNIPGNYEYCFSLYLSSPTPDSVILFRRSGNSEDSLLVQVSAEWKRFWTAGNLQDPSEGLSVGIRLSPGQQVAVSAAQLQPQPGMSPYLNRAQAGDVYPNSHWAIDEFSVRYLGPNDCSVSVAVES